MAILFTVFVTICCALLVSYYLSKFETIPVELISVSASLLVSSTAAFIKLKSTISQDAVFLLLFGWLCLIFFSLGTVAAYSYHIQEMRKFEASKGSKSWMTIAYFVSIFLSLVIFVCSLTISWNIGTFSGRIDPQQDTAFVIFDAVFSNLSLLWSIVFVSFGAVVATWWKISRIRVHIET